LSIYSTSEARDYDEKLIRQPKSKFFLEGLFQQFLKQQEKRKLNNRRFENPKTGRKTWIDINNVLDNHSKPDQPIVFLNDDDVPVKEQVRVADTFNEYFTSIGEELAAGLDDVSDSGVVHDRNLSSIFLFETNSGTELGKITDKASGYDQVSVRAMKACKHELISYLVHSINCSMISGIYPDCLKLAKVGPLHKSGNKRHVGNYRPVPVGSLICQQNLRESHLPQIVDIYQQAWIIGLLSNFQLGFREKSSTAGI
jgi:hypothetical protein